VRRWHRRVAVAALLALFLKTPMAPDGMAEA